MSKGQTSVRYAEVDRETKESRVQVVLDLDGGSRQDIKTGIGFFDHMLMQFAFHGCFNLGVDASGDLHVDDHHTVEDVGIVVGKAIRQALAESNPYARFASTHTPMDEALVLVAVDISGRGQLHFEADFHRDRIGEMSTDSIREFFQALSIHAGITTHIRKITGHNDHHVCEAIFKGFGRAMNAATRLTDGHGLRSTKGSID